MNYAKFHEIDENPETNEHLREILESIRTNGWQGLPLLSLDGETLINGCHRATACEILGIEPEVHVAEIKCKWGDDEFTDELLGYIYNGASNNSLLYALRTMHELDLIDELSLEIFEAEYEKE